MLLKKIKLENIRSYTNQEIRFPEGSTLLAGNIGSGKTSILLAIDFALFGLRRGNLSGASLLRNGTNKGSVEFHFNIDSNNVIVKRTLRRNGSVTQDSGYLIVNDVRKDLSPVELKQNILDILNYPKDMLTRSKDLVYRYTVYTPQDEMKQILLSDNELRLETLRKVFGIDRYKLIKDNTEIFISSIKEKKKEFLGYIIDLNSKLIELENLNNKINNLDKEIIILEPLLNETNKKIKTMKDELKKIQDNIKKLNDIRKNLEINEQKLDNNLERIKENNLRVKELEKEIEELNKIIKINLDMKEIQKNMIKLKEDIEQLENKLYSPENNINNVRIKLKEDIEELENKLYSVKNKINEARIKINNSSKIMEDIIDLSICPVCKQNVTKNYREDIIENENALISHLKSELRTLEKEEDNISSKIKDSKLKLDDINDVEKEYEVNKIRLDTISSKLTDIESLKELTKRLKGEVGEINVRNGILYKELESLKDIEDHSKEKNEELESLLQEQKNIEIKKNSFEVEKRNIDSNIKSLSKEVKKKEQRRKYIENLSSIQDWLENYFVVSLDVIENNIMLKVYSDFNSLFQKWFYTLVDTDDINIKLNQDFSPLIQQNNHDIDYIYLSGGEKTAAALAYRLALNQVINNIMSAIKTNDLIILDEPTDGFSDEQLDRIRIVIKELKLRQIIIVSHEPKIETFVDNVIRFKKENHITTLI